MLMMRVRIRMEMGGMIGVRRPHGVSLIGLKNEHVSMSTDDALGSIRFFAFRTKSALALLVDPGLTEHVPGFIKPANERSPGGRTVVITKLGVDFPVVLNVTIEVETVPVSRVGVSQQGEPQDQCLDRDDRPAIPV